MKHSLEDLLKDKPVGTLINGHDYCCLEWGETFRAALRGKYIAEVDLDLYKVIKDLKGRTVALSPTEGFPEKPKIGFVKVFSVCLQAYHILFVILGSIITHLFKAGEHPAAIGLCFVFIWILCDIVINRKESP